MPKATGPRPEFVVRKCRLCKDAKAKFKIVGGPPDDVLAVCGSCKGELKICGAMKRGKICFALRPHGRCDKHGGSELSGRPVIHGRYSKYLPVRLQERAMEALKDPDLVSMREDLATIEVLITEVLEGFGDEGTAELWKRACSAFRGVQHLGQGCTTKEDKEAWNDLRSALEDGDRVAQKIEQFIELSEQKRKHSDTEVKRLVALRNFMTAQEANRFVAAIQAIIIEEVSSKNEQKRIGTRLMELVR